MSVASPDREPKGLEPITAGVGASNTVRCSSSPSLHPHQRALVVKPARHETAAVRSWTEPGSPEEIQTSRPAGSAGSSISAPRPRLFSWKPTSGQSARSESPAMR